MRRIKKAILELDIDEYAILGGDPDGHNYEVYYKGKEIEVVGIIRNSILDRHQKEVKNEKPKRRRPNRANR